MAPLKSELTINQKQSWSKVNKSRKEERKSWKEQNLVRKIEKQKQKKTDKSLEIEKVTLTEKTAKGSSTLSVAVPGSILENAQSAELRTYLAGQIARAVSLFEADEIVVFDDFGDEAGAKKAKYDDESGEEKVARHSSVQLGRILQYLECPQYLRKSFFPIHNDLKYCGLLNPLNTPHHLGPHDEFMFREGVVLSTPAKPGKGSLVNVGLLKPVRVDKLLVPGIRCTVKLSAEEETNHTKKLRGIIVSPSAPRNETGIYWGYRVRIANSLSKVFSQCPYKEGYDLTIGTSDKGIPVDSFDCPKYKHLLVMFGGLHGLEAALENDSVLEADDPRLLFDHYLNTLPHQGSKTIRTEEAMLISLTALRPKLNPEVKNKVFSEDSIKLRHLETDEKIEIIEGNTTGDTGNLECDMSKFD